MELLSLALDEVSIYKQGRWAYVTCINCGPICERGPFQSDSTFKRVAGRILRSEPVRFHHCKQRD